MILGAFSGLLALSRWTMVIGGILFLVLSLGIKGPRPICDGAPMRDGDRCEVSGTKLTVDQVARHEDDAEMGLRIIGGVALVCGVIWFLALDSRGRRRAPSAVTVGG